MLFSEVQPGPTTVPKGYLIEDKIEHNKVIRYRGVIDNYGAYYSICAESFDSLNSQQPNSRRLFFASATAIYQGLMAKLGLTPPFKDGEADQIIEMFHSILKQKMVSDPTQLVWDEETDYTLLALICYLFAECKILEKPKNASRPR